MAPEASELMMPSARLQLKGYTREMAWAESTYPQPTKTAAHWFSRKWPQEFQTQGCPFLELSASQFRGREVTKPIALNELFFAAILSDQRLGHKLVFCPLENIFYFKDVRDSGLFKPTTEAKLKMLLSRWLLQCAEELGEDAPLYNLFVKFRSDDELQKVVNAAKSMFTVDDSFFGLDSPNARLKGTEVHGKFAKTFIQVFIEVNPQKNLTVLDTYTAFGEYCMKNGLMLVERRVFEDLISELIRLELGFNIRNDVPHVTTGRHQRGWMGLGLKQLENLPIDVEEISRSVDPIGPAGP